MQRQALHARWQRAVDKAAAEHERARRLVNDSRALVRAARAIATRSELAAINSALARLAQRTPLQAVRGLDHDDADAPEQLADRLARACAAMFGVTSAGFAMVREGEHLGAVAYSDSDFAEIDELQFAFGEGPSIDAVTTGRPVLVADLAAAANRWPAFSAAALALGVRAAFAVPLASPTAPVNVLALYRRSPGELALSGAPEPDRFAFDMAQRCFTHLADATPPGTLPERVSRSLDRRTEVYQATGTIAAQIKTNPDDALRLLRARAWSEDRSVFELAAAVVSGTVHFGTDE